MQTAAIQVSLPKTEIASQSGHDPMEIRWGIQCGVRDKNIESWRAGFTDLVFGQFFPIKRFPTVQEIHSTDDNPNFPRSQMVTETADSVELYLSEMLAAVDGAGNPAPSKPHFGIQFGFRGESDIAKMAVISATLLPELDAIRRLATTSGIANPIGDRCDGQDPEDFTARTSCPTCWVKWIDSPLCDAHIKSVIEFGMDCDEYDPNTRESVVRNIRPTVDEFAQARQMVRQSLLTGLSTLQGIWATLVDELEKGERRGMDPYQQRIRKDVHGTKPQDKQIAMMREFGRASAGNTADNGSNDVLAALAASAIRTEQILGAILGARSTGNFNIPADAPAPATVAAEVPVVTTTEAAKAPAKKGDK